MPWKPISARADGLLSLLGIKNLGRNPEMLMETVQPVLDAQGWYLRSSSVGYNGSGNFAFTSEVIFPAELAASDQEWLYVHYAYFEIFGVAAGAPRARMGIFRNTPGNAATFWSTPRSDPLPIGGAEQSMAVARDLWIPPGCQLILSGDDVTVPDAYIYGALVSRVLV